MKVKKPKWKLGDMIIYCRDDIDKFQIVTEIIRFSDGDFHYNNFPESFYRSPTLDELNTYIS